jgi:hypothetical protein
MSVYDPYTECEPIGMDHPYFMARMHARMEASWAANEGMPLPEALRAIRLRMQGLFGEVPLALVDSAVSGVYAQHEAVKPR